MEKPNTMHTTTQKEVYIDGHDLSLEEFIAVSKYHARICISKDLLNHLQQNRDLITKFSEEKQPIYGVTTGFGDNVHYTINPAEAQILQKNILRSHACAVGAPLEEEEVRAIILMILLNISHGISGVQVSTFLFLTELLNKDLYPFAPSEGSVGYLAVEAHICLTLLGEGFFLINGQKTAAKKVLDDSGIAPVDLGCKEGLALITGTTSSTALALLSLFYTRNAKEHLEIVNALVYESLKATTKALAPVIHAQKQHKEQAEAAKQMLHLLDGSEICETYGDTKVQDACLLRTMAQIMGANCRLIDEAEKVFLEEMHSCSDNPILIPDKSGSGTAWMTGNFDGSYLATHCDILCISMANMGGLIERSTDRMVNHHLSDGLPPFLITKPGLNNGFMIPQYTQAGLLGQIKLYAAPASIDSISTCAGQEDPVSMAYNAAKKALASSRLLLQMVAIELMTSIQAVDLTVSITGCHQSPLLKKVRDKVREHIDFLSSDRYLFQDMEASHALIESRELLNLVR